jgi:hypothetical protein
MSCTFAQLNDIITYGSYYYPATSHYTRSCTVMCDRCKKTNISACIGYNNFDLCLECVDKVIKEKGKIVDVPVYLPDEKPLIRMMSDRFFESLRNSNSQDDQIKRKQYISKMMSERFHGSSGKKDDVSTDSDDSDNYKTLMMSQKFFDQYKNKN